MSARKILLVDDEASVRNLLKMMLQATGDDFLVSDAASGEEALSLIREQKFDLVFTDILMPGMSGIDLHAAVKLESIDVAFIFTSGIHDEELIAHIGEKGIFIGKPFYFPQMYSAILTIFGIPKSMDQNSSDIGAAV